MNNQEGVGNLNLFAYNTIVSTGMPLYASGMDSKGSGITLYTFGEIKPSGALTLFQRGYQPYV
jgi:hypothetical protein